MKFDEQLLVDHLIWAEREELNLYPDSEGILTIGIGHNIEHKGISKPVSRQMLKEDLAEVYADCARLNYYDALDAVRQMVVADMMFNLGASRFARFRKFHAAMRQKDYSEAEAQMIDSKWHRQTKRRAYKLEKIMRTGVWE